jgi:deazaflavin-dependent oxidoreductase (nitroreductase family)
MDSGGDGYETTGSRALPRTRLDRPGAPALAGRPAIVCGMPDRYLRPGWFTKNVLDRIVAGLTRLGVSVLGSRVLEVRGRTSGEPRRVPVNLLILEGDRYLVAPRGEAQWVRNLRASGGEGALLLGSRREPFIADELSDDEKTSALRAYLKRWKAEIGVFFQGVGPDAPDEELRRIASGYPVFRLRDR